MTSASALGLVLVLKRPWMRRTWFWIALALVAVLQVELVLSVHWPTEWIPARNWAGAATVDFVVIILFSTSWAESWNAENCRWMMRLSRRHMPARHAHATKTGVTMIDRLARDAAAEALRGLMEGRLSNRDYEKAISAQQGRRTAEPAMKPGPFKAFHRWLASTISRRALAWLSCVAWLVAAGGCGADRTVILQCPSPDRTAKAIFWAYAAGGAEGVAFVELDVVPAARPTASVIESDEHQRGEVMNMVVAGTVRLTWLTSRRLLVEYPEEGVLHLAAPGWPVYATDVPNLRVIYRGSADIVDYSASTCANER
jgi:hypothetical protein